MSRVRIPCPALRKLNQSGRLREVLNRLFSYPPHLRSRPPTILPTTRRGLGSWRVRTHGAVIDKVNDLCECRLLLGPVDGRIMVLHAFRGVAGNGARDDGLDVCRTREVIECP